MPIALPKLRCSWVALAAFVGSLLASGGVSASCSSMPRAGACASACGCCKAGDSGGPTRESAASMTDRLPIPSPNGNVCPDTPGCGCSPQAPSAPAEPKEQRAEEHRPDRNRDVAADWFVACGVSRSFADAVLPTVSPPLKAPLYLRNSRLLI